ncbi:hypothetical protein Tco_0677289, partial [Tanacetum coccineum]
MRPAPDPSLFEAPLVYNLHAFEGSGMSSTLGLLGTSAVALISAGVSAR